MIGADFDLDLPSGHVRARRWGAEGAPLLLWIHGLSANLCGFTYLAEHLAGPHRQVVAIDLRGRGRSEVTPPAPMGWTITPAMWSTLPPRWVPTHSTSPDGRSAR